MHGHKQAKGAMIVHAVFENNVTSGYKYMRGLRATLLDAETVHKRKNACTRGSMYVFD